MSKVLVTGGSGFIGSRLCERLQAENYDLKVGKDTRDFNPERPDIIYHLGEYARVLPSFDDIDKVAEWNGIGTLRVLEYCRKNKVRLIYAGSSTKFGDVESPYSFFKAQNTELIKKYGEWFGLDYVICYFYNVYGPGEKDTLIAKFAESDVLTVNSPGTQKRIFTHVDDIVDGLILAGEKGSGEYCFGSNEEYSVLEVAEMFGKPIVMSEPKRGDRNYSKIDRERANELGWKAKHNLKEWIQHLGKK